MAKYNVKNAPRRVRLRWLKKAQAARKYYAKCGSYMGKKAAKRKAALAAGAHSATTLSVAAPITHEEVEVPLGTSNNPFVSRRAYRRATRDLRGQGFFQRQYAYPGGEIREEYSHYPRMYATRAYLPGGHPAEYAKGLKRLYWTRNPGLSDNIRAGDRVTIADRFGKLQTGRAVMRSSMGGWVLNMGGRYGTPALADDQNIVRVGGGRSRGHNPELLVMTNPGTLRVGKHGRTDLMKRHRRRHRRYNSWYGQSRRHSYAAKKGWRHRKHGRKYSKRAHKKHVRMGGRKYGWKALVKRMGVKKAHLIWRKRAKNPRRRFRRSRR